MEPRMAKVQGWNADMLVAAFVADYPRCIAVSRISTCASMWTSQYHGGLGRHELRGAAVQRLDLGHRVLPGAPDRAMEPERVLLRRGCEQSGHAAQPGGHRQRQHLLHGEPRPALQRGSRPGRPEPCQVRRWPHSLAVTPAADKKG